MVFVIFKVSLYLNADAELSSLYWLTGISKGLYKYGTSVYQPW